MSTRSFLSSQISIAVFKGGSFQIKLNKEKAQISVKNYLLRTHSRPLAISPSLLCLAFSISSLLSDRQWDVRIALLRLPLSEVLRFTQKSCHSLLSNCNSETKFSYLRVESCIFFFRNPQLYKVATFSLYLFVLIFHSEHACFRRGICFGLPDTGECSLCKYDQQEIAIVIILKSKFLINFYVLTNLFLKF